jgi:glycosyltransferase involved in cell wall biosynthesis
MTVSVRVVRAWAPPITVIASELLASVTKIVHLNLSQVSRFNVMKLTVLMAIGSPDFTGAPRMALLIARALKNAGHRVIVVSGQRPPIDQTSVLDPLRAEGFETVEEVGFDRKFPDRGLIRRISALVRREKVQCLISEEPQDFKVMPFVAKQTAVNLIYHVQNAARFYGNPIVRMLKWFGYQRMVSKHTTKLICVSEAVREQHIKEFRVPASRVTVVDNGVDRGQFGPISLIERLAIRTEMGVADGEFLLLNVGRLTFQKGQDLLLRALALANLNGRSFKLVIVGTAGHGNAEDAAYESELRRLAQLPGLAGRVVFAGWRNDVAKLLRSADMYLHSANWEGLPLAVLEAMASALPSVSTDCAGLLSGFVSGYHGDVVQTGNETAFRQAVERLAGLSDVERAKIGRAAELLVAKNFDIAMTTRRFVSIVEQVVDDRSE